MREIGVSEIRMLTVADAAEALSVSTKWVRAAVASGQLPGVKLGGCVRIPQADLMQVLQRSRIEAKTPAEMISSQPKPRRREGRSAHEAMNAKLRALGIRV